MWAQKAFSGDIMNLSENLTFCSNCSIEQLKSWFIKDSMSFDLVLNFFCSASMNKMIIVF